MKVLIATTNQGKIDIYSQAFRELGLDFCSLKDLNISVDVEETGKTEAENALIKAREYHKLTGMPVVANDSGLIIDKLKPEDQPGVFVRRNHGKELTDEELLNVYVEKIKEVGGQSTGHFNVALAIIDESGKEFVREFKPQRLFVSTPNEIIKKGIPLDSIAFDPETGKYMSEMTTVERNKYEGEELLKQQNFIKEIFSMNRK